MTVKRTSIAKISTPRLFGVVARERLFARLDENRDRPLIWIEGPPGAGKTTLVASYLEARGLPTLWYQVDSGDADPANLFHYLASAAADLLEAAAVPLPRLAAEHFSDLPGFARMFFREFFSRLPAGTVLVLDNYQEAPPGALLHEILPIAAEQVPANGSMLGVSRANWPGSCAQLVANGMLVGLRWDALRLTLEETRAIAAERDVRDDWLVRALHDQSEGWATGITLMLERLGHMKGNERELPTGARETVFQYFASLLIDSASESTRGTLQSLAFLPNVTASMAKALSGNDQAGAVLDQMYRRHLFTDRRPGTEAVYQFHSLFRDFLKTRLRDTEDEVAVRWLMRRSADVLEGDGQFDAAVDLRLLAEDWDGAVRLVLGIAPELLNCGRRHTLEQWIGTLPDRVIEANPWLSYWLGMACAQTSSNRGAAMLKRAFARFRSTNDRLGRILSVTALLNGAFAGYVAVEGMHHWLDELLLVMEEPLSFSSPDVELQVWGVLCSTLFWVRPWHPWTRQAVERVEALLPQVKDSNVALAAASSALATTALSGDFERGDRIASETARHADAPGASPAATAWWHVWAGYLQFLEAGYDEALANMRQSCAIADANGMRATFTTTIYHRYMVEFRVSGWAVAGATLEEIKRLPRPTYPVGEAMLNVYQARRAHFLGQREEAADLAEKTDTAILRSGSPYQEMLFGLVDAELLLDAGRIEAARACIARSRTIIEQCPAFDCFLGGLLFCEALLKLVEGDRHVAANRLRTAFGVIREKSRRYFLRYLEVCMPRMFSLALEEGIEVDLVQQLIRMFRLKPPADAPDLWPRPVRIQTLGRFEVRIKDEPLEFSRKVPKKTLALLKALLAHGAEAVPEQWLCDSLWGDEEADAARQVLGVTVPRLRKLLGNDETVVQQGGKVWLDRRLCWVDSWRLEESLSPAGGPDGVRSALNLYAGAFLPDDEGEPWSVPMRERLRGKFIHALATYGQTLEVEGHVDEALRLYQRGIDADVIVEAFHRGLMRCYRKTGRLTEAVSAYRRLRQTISVVLGVAPSRESEQLYREILADLAAEPEERRPVGAEPSPVPPIAARHRRGPLWHH